MKRLFVIITIVIGIVVMSGCTERHTVAFDSRGGLPVEAIKVKEGSTANLPSAVREGHTFLGWYTDDLFGVAYTDSTPVTSSITLFARWGVNSYTMTFESNGGSQIPDMTFTYDEWVIIRIQPHREGYDFDGWYMDPSFETQYVEGKMPAENFTLWAKWTPMLITVSFDSGGGTSVRASTVVYGTPLIKPEDPVRTGYDFVGWYVDTARTVYYDFQTTPGQDITLYAGWSAKPYTVSFDYNGATSGTNLSFKTVRYNEAYGILPTPSREGHTFLGWFTAPTSYAPVTQDSIMTRTDTHTLYAKWRLESFTISFETDGGTLVPDIHTLFGNTINRPTDPYKEGHTFLGWYETPAYNSLYTFSTMPGQDTTLYAKWLTNTYTVHYETYDGTPVGSESYPFGTMITEPDEPQKEGHTFMGWWIEDDPDNDTVFGPMPSRDLVIHADWRINTYAMTFIDHADALYGTLVANGHHAFSIDSDGDLHGWGENTDGQLGNGTQDNVYEPENLSGMFPFDPFETTDAIFAGVDHTFVMSSTGRIFAFGKNTWGQLGTGDIDHRLVPYDITDALGLDPDELVTDMSAGTTHSLAVTDKGTVLVWGHNHRGQLGNGTTTGSSLPVDITGMFPLDANDKIVSVDAGSSFSVAVSDQGRIFTWGMNSEGQLGNGTKDNRSVPFEITLAIPLLEGESVEMLETGSAHATLLTTHGRVFAWGSSSHGQIGNYTSYGDVLFPAEITSRLSVNEDERIIQISTSDETVIARSSEGTIFTWGNNSNGQIGDGDDGTPQKVPLDITHNVSLMEGESVISVQAGAITSYVLTDFGRVFAWGNNYYGQFGAIDNTSVTSPVDVTERFISDHRFMTWSVTAMSWSAYALGSDGRILSWGRNDDGQLGDGTRTDRPVPQDVTDGFGLIDGERLSHIESGNGHVIALTSSNRVFTWGQNGSGQLGNDSVSRQESPVDITSRFGFHDHETVADIDAGSSHSLVVTSTGRVFAWGSNGSGQLGNGATSSQRTPFEITEHFDLEEDDKVIAITAGTTHTLAITSQGRLFAWGSNTSGQLGYELQISRKTPFDITSMMRLGEDESITGLGASGYTSYVITSHGRLIVWGGNTKGQIGDGTTDNRFSPFDITPSLGLSQDDTIEDVILGPTHMGVITAQDRVIIWGSNLYGSFGNGTTSDVVQMPTDITHVFGLDDNESLIGLSFGSESTYAVTSFHRVLAFGSNHYNKLAYTQGTLPYPVLGPVIRTRMHVYDTPYQMIEPVTDAAGFIGWTLNQGSEVTFTDGLMPAQDITLFSIRDNES
jgi:uncharacterized repeat protein (TIGR02543 family)